MSCYLDFNDCLISAIRSGNLEEVRKLIDSFGLSYSNAWSKDTLLCDALSSKHSEVAKVRVTKGSKVNSKNIAAYSPLHIAVENGYKEIVEMLLDRGANVNAKERYGRTPLHIAVRRGHVQIVIIVLNRNADIDAQNQHGRTALHCASIGKSCDEIIKLLLDRGANVDAKDESGRKPLHIATEGGHLQIVKQLLKHGADVNSVHTTRQILTPLYIAVARRHEKLVGLLLEYGAKVDTQFKDDKTVLFLAAQSPVSSIIIENILKYSPDFNNKGNRNAFLAVCYSGQAKIVESFLQCGFTVDLEDVKNRKLLYAAIKNGFLKILEDLLKLGTDVNGPLAGGCIPLHFAVKNSQKEVAKLLVSYGADVNAKDKIEKTAIFYATENWDLEITKLLLTNGATVKDSPDILCTAVKNECRDIVEILLNHDADVNATDYRGRTPLHYTALFEYVDYGKDRDIKREIAELLLSRGANVNAKTENGRTTLYAAIEKGYAEVVNVLLEYNADVNFSVKNNLTPLSQSAIKGNEVIGKMLLDAGANVNFENESGATALHIATGKGYKGFVELLLKFGAKADSKDKRGRSLLHTAAEKCRLNIVQILLKFGADIDARDENGETALHIASKKLNTAVVNAILEYGSDINIVSKTNYTPHSYIMAHPPSIDDYGSSALTHDRRLTHYNIFFNAFQEVAKVLKNHIVKIKIANLYLSEINIKSITEKDIDPNFQNECEEEINRMKSEKITDTKISFHDILTKNVNQLAIYATDKNIVEVISSDDYRAKFPMYASMMKSNFRKGIERKVLTEQSNIIFYSLFNNFRQLPYNCTEKIFSYLSNEDLKCILSAYKTFSTY